MELGLDPKTADMEYILEQWIDEETGRHKEEYCEIPVVRVDDDDCPLQQITLPCWSLSALLEQLPLYIMSQFGGYHLNIERKEGVWKCGYCFYESSIGGYIYFAYSFVEDSFPAIEKPDLMDAVYEMMMNYLRFAKKFLPHAYFVKKESNNK